MHAPLPDCDCDCDRWRLQGYTIVPINVALANKGESILGSKAVASVAEVEAGVEIVDIFDEQNPYYIPV